ncbi:MAG: HlyD family efflux transporter periplasmic adaptor subunit [Treponema sp.]|nr:HlyD family efflux transporter periplasmic adaptor subunit [Treponema sp.]
MNKKVKRVLLAIIAVIAVSGGIFYKTRPMSPATTVIMPKSADLSFTEQGLVLAQRQVEIYAAVSGQITQLDVVEGQHVNKGDILCKVDDSEFRSEIRQMESSSKGYRAQINTLTTTTRKQNVSVEDQIEIQNIRISQSEEGLARARDKAEKYKSLSGAGYIPEQDLTDAENAVKDAERDLNINKQQLQVIMTGTQDMSEEKYYNALIEGNRAGIEQLNKKIEDTVTRAPVSGLLSVLNIKDTNAVNAQNPIAVIMADRDCVVEVYVSVKDIDAAKTGKKVLLILEGHYADKEIPGTIIAVDDFAVDQVSVLGVEERRVKVTIAPDETGELKDGYDPDVRFSYYHEDNKITVPKTAVFRENDIDKVWAVKNGKAQKIQVQKGMELRSEFVIENGLTQNDIIINDSNLKGLRDGVKIRI